MFGSLQVRLSDLAHSYTSCQLLIKRCAQSSGNPLMDLVCPENVRLG